jgi:glycine cleavage system protein P-like pyridoxal-binding family
MDDTLTSTSDPLDVEPTASSSKDRSDGSYRFIEALHAARRQVERDPGPPVELHLSQRAKDYVEHLDGDESQRENHRRKKRHDEYPTRMHHGTHEPSAPGMNERDGGTEDD